MVRAQRAQQAHSQVAKVGHKPAFGGSFSCVGDEHLYRLEEKGYPWSDQVYRLRFSGRASAERPKDEQAMYLLLIPGWVATGMLEPAPQLLNRAVET